MSRHRGDFQTTASTTYEIDDSPGLTEAASTPEKVTEGSSSPGHPTLPPKRRGPVIAGGIVRFDLGATRSDES